MTTIENAPASTSAATNHQPIEEKTNAWTEATIPDRVSSVPRIDRQNVSAISETFQTFSIPFFSCTITECRKAVPTSHGTSAAFSTGSQPQKPPQPTSTYAQCAPSSMPMPRNDQAA